MNIDNNDSNNDNSGNRGKFSDRIKKIQRDKAKRKIDIEKEENFVVRGIRNVLKVALAFPSVIYTSMNSSKKGNNSIEKDSGKKEIYADMSEYHELENLRKIRVSKIRDLDISSLKKQREMYLKEKKHYKNKSDDVNFKDEEFKVIKLQKEIMDIIKKKLIKNINELEVLQSELFLLKEINNDDIYLNKCHEDIKEIKKLLSKIKSLKEKYDYLKDNVDFEYMLEYEDDLLIDKILELKRICSQDDVRYTIDNYKLLEEYKFLYLKIDKIQEDTIKYEEYKNSKVEELKQRDIDFEKMKNDVYDIDRENDRYENFVKEQEIFLKKLEEKISQIDSHEDVTYKLKGFNQLLGNSFKYLGLLLVNPLKGLIPSIATQTLVTRNVIHNLYNNLEWEENRKMVYEAIDYSDSINIAINDLNLTASMIDSTLEDIAKLKAKYIKDFSKYEFSFAGYREAIKKINKIENSVLGSKIKIVNYQLKMREHERKNSNKLKMVKKLNTSSK